MAPYTANYSFYVAADDEVKQQSSCNFGAWAAEDMCASKHFELSAMTLICFSCGAVLEVWRYLQADLSLSCCGDMAGMNVAA